MAPSTSTLDLKLFGIIIYPMDPEAYLDGPWINRTKPSDRMGVAKVRIGDDQCHDPDNEIGPHLS